MEKQKTILVTFAGRKDRMSLLTRYVDAAIERGLIDEWHVWDFTRNAADARWLRERFPIVQVTPSHTDEYFLLPGTLSVRGNNRSVKFSVRATNDVHIGLRRRGASGTSYEIVVGGWNNRASAIRRFASPLALTAQQLRNQEEPPAVYASTPQILPEFDFVDVEIRFGADGLRVSVAGEEILRDDVPVADGEFEALYRTGYGANGDWRFDCFNSHAARLFVGGRAPFYSKDVMFYTTAYQYYAANRDAHAQDVFLKCDDDIVYVDLDRLGDFIDFRRANDDYFLISANVVNNGVCAYFQQQFGVIPHNEMTLELPPGGMCGSLWGSGAKAEALHRLFLRAPSRFTFEEPSALKWNERVSINFVAFLGRDLVHIPDIMADDEHDLCYGVRKRARKENSVYFPFVVSHLSFWRQDAEMNVAGLVAAYERLADQTLRRTIVAPPSQAAKSAA